MQVLNASHQQVPADLLECARRAADKASRQSKVAAKAATQGAEEVSELEELRALQLENREKQREVLQARRAKESGGHAPRKGKGKGKK